MAGTGVVTALSVIHIRAASLQLFERGIQVFLISRILFCVMYAFMYQLVLSKIPFIFPGTCRK
jgi:hypothetical protein